MKLSALVNTLPLVSGAKIVLATASPLQSYLDRPGRTHGFCNSQAVKVMKQDGLEEEAALFKLWLPRLNAGAYWADQGWKNINHYYDPVTGNGLWKFTPATDEFAQYWHQAEKAIRDNDLVKSFFFLGAAAHLVQDLCVPHHARAKMLDGHKQYEAWAQANRNVYAVAAGGIYEPANVYQLVAYNAAIAADCLSWVNTEGTESTYHSATAILLPLAQRTTAGLFQHFAALVNKMTMLDAGVELRIPA